MEVEGITDNGHVSEEPQLDQEPLKNAATNSVTTSQPATSATGGFDCNICLDFAVDPVVTLCGHLYCWPCIYKWLQVENSAVQNCPVCKASLSEESLVPLYGRGHSTKRAHQTLDIPRRPHHQREQTDPDNEENYGDTQPMPVHRHRHHHHYHVHHHYPYNNSTNSNEFASAPSSPYLGATGRALGGMAIAVLPWMFRNQQEFTNMQIANPSPYYFNGIHGGSPRMRRQEMEVERSLHQIWLFLSCCTLLCLLLF